MTLDTQALDRLKVEDENRYLAPAQFKAPKKLAGMRRFASQQLSQTNRYFEAYRDVEAVLAAAGCKLRIRETAGAEAVATLKMKPTRGDQGAKRVRLELEEPLERPQLDPSNSAVSAAMRLAGDAPLIEQYHVQNLRIVHLYQDDAGNSVGLCQDFVTYPDGSREDRLEVELVSGDASVLDRCETELQQRYGKLKPVKRGKPAEARRRLGR